MDNDKYQTKSNGPVQAEESWSSPAAIRGDMQAAAGGRLMEADARYGPGRPPSAGVTLESVDRAMTFHPSTSRRQVDAFEQVREGCIALAKTILRTVPECADRSTALRELRAVRMWANSAIANDGEF